MKKILLTALVVTYSLMLSGISKAEVSLSGYQEFYGGSADQSINNSIDTSTGAGITNSSFNGFSNGRFTRLTAVGKTTLDSGIAVTGTLNISKNSDSGGDADTQGVGVDQNDIIFSGGFGSLAIGNNFSAGTHMHFRGTTLVPTAEPDNDQVHRFATMGDAARGYGRYDEAGYALDGMKMRFMSNVYEGFSVGISYEPCMVQNSANASATDCNTTTAASEHSRYTDLTDMIIKYQGEFDGVGLGVTYGYQTGNTSVTGTGAAEYNDLKGQTMSAQLTYAGFTLVARNNDLGDSGQVTTNTDDGGEEADTLAIRYNMGNFSVGYASIETEKGVTNQSVKNSASYSVTAFGYNLGGGVNLEAAYISMEQKEGATVDTDVDMVLTKLSFGF